MSQKKYMHELPTNFDGFETCNMGHIILPKNTFLHSKQPLPKRRKITKKTIFLYKFQIDQAVMFGSHIFLIAFLTLTMWNALNIANFLFF